MRLFYVSIIAFFLCIIFYGLPVLNIVLELTNIEKEISLYNLTPYRDLIINSLIKAVKTMKSLIKTKYYKCYTFNEDFLNEFGFNYWDKKQFGLNETIKSFRTCDFDIDLLIVVRFFNRTENLDDLTMVNSDVLYMGSNNKAPVVGEIILSKNIDFSKKNSNNFLEYLFLHHITHILGFNSYYIKNVFNNYTYTIIDSDSVTRYYINSTRVIKVAKKYFNCSDIKGVELEEDGNELSAHWESRTLLGEYMNKYMYTEEQVI